MKEAAPDDVTREAIARARALPARVPAASRRDEVRAALLAGAAAEPVGRGRRPWIAGVAALAAAASFAPWFVLAPRGPAPARSRVVVHARAGARYATVSAPPWETFQLAEGTIELEVAPLGPRERVRVQTSDGEVEVRGTRFEVTARGGRLVGVDVTRGRVEVRPAGAATTVLVAGERWRARDEAPDEAPDEARDEAPDEAPAPPPPTALAPRAPAPRARVGRAAAAVEALVPTRQEVLYDDAWDALRARRFDEAAAGFARVLAEAPTGPLADEAAFWRATAIARGGGSARAIAAFEAFLVKYRTARRGEASAILGWLLVDAHRGEEAAPLFRASADDPREGVRSSARDGLAAIARARR